MRFARPRNSGIGSPLAPLLDVVLLLLIFFVVTSSFANQRLDLVLPSVESGEPATPDALIVEINEEGTILVDGVAHSLEALRSRFAEAGRAGRSVELHADRSTNHGDVVRLLDAARMAGLDGLSIAVLEGGSAAMPARVEHP